jgi:tetratricopeptide (TPR) repeat protein
MDIWEKFINNPSKMCISLFEEEYRKTGDLPTLYNHNLVLLDIGDWPRAKSNYETIIKKSESSCDAHFIRIGMTDWFLGNITIAINYWKRACSAVYVDSVGAIDGPIVLWYAGQCLRDEKLAKESVKRMKKYWTVTDYTKIVKWPGTIAIAGFLLDQVPIDDFLVKWKWEGPEPLEIRRLCRAHFWVGMKLLGQNQEQAIKHFKAAYSADKRAILQYEYFLAKWEYARLTGQDLWEKNLSNGAIS